MRSPTLVPSAETYLLAYRYMQLADRVLAFAGAPTAMAVHPDLPIVAVCQVHLHWLCPELQRLCLPGRKLSNMHPFSLLDAICAPA